MWEDGGGSGGFEFVGNLEFFLKSFVLVNACDSEEPWGVLYLDEYVFIYITLVMRWWSLFLFVGVYCSIYFLSHLSIFTVHHYLIKLCGRDIISKGPP